MAVFFCWCGSLRQSFSTALAACRRDVMLMIAFFSVVSLRIPPRASVHISRFNGLCVLGSKAQAPQKNSRADSPLTPLSPDVFVLCMHPSPDTIGRFFQSVGRIRAPRLRGPHGIAGRVWQAGGATSSTRNSGDGKCGRRGGGAPEAERVEEQGRQSEASGKLIGLSEAFNFVLLLPFFFFFAFLW